MNYGRLVISAVRAHLGRSFHIGKERLVHRSAPIATSSIGTRRNIIKEKGVVRDINAYAISNDS